MRKELNLRKIRENVLALSRPEFSQKFGIGRTTIENCEKKNNWPKSPVTRAKYMKALGLDPAEYSSSESVEVSNG